MNFRRYLVKKLITKPILEGLIHDNDDVVEEIINENFDYYMHRYFNRQHVNCRCTYGFKIINDKNETDNN